MDLSRSTSARAVAGKLGDAGSVPLGNPPIQMVLLLEFQSLGGDIGNGGEVSNLESKQFSK